MFLQRLIPRSTVNLHRISRDYLPPTLPFRELELRWLGRALAPFAKLADRNTAIVLVGGRGVGKSAITQMVTRVVASSTAMNGDRNTCIVYSATTPRSLHGFLSEILNHLLPFKTTVGVSDDELVGILGKVLVQSDLRLIVLLDSLKLSQGSASLLKRFIELKDSVRSKPICLIVSTRTQTAELEGFGSSSTLEVKSYSKSQVDEILTYRMRLAGVEGMVEGQAKEYIVEQAGLNGDMGYAIGLLAGGLAVATRLKDTKIRLEHVAQVGASYLDPSVSLSIRKLEPHEKLFLYSVCSFLQQNDQTMVSMGEVESEYSKLCLRLNLKPRMHTQLWCYVQKLSDLGIIDAWVDGSGRRGRTTNISVPHKLNPIMDELGKQIKNISAHVYIPYG
ncbi:MAG: hypothetical protein QW514_02925 [Thermoprotei archaeon]